MQVRQARDRYVRWLRATKDLSPHTIRAYEGDISALERHLSPDPVVSQIDRGRLLDFIEKQRATGLSPRSIRRRAVALRGFCNWLVSSHLLESDPWPGTSLPVGRARKLPRVVARHQLALIFGLLHRRAGLSTPPACDDVLARPADSTTLLAVALMVSGSCGTRGAVCAPPGAATPTRATAMTVATRFRRPIKPADA